MSGDDPQRSFVPLRRLRKGDTPEVPQTTFQKNNPRKQREKTSGNSSFALPAPHSTLVEVHVPFADMLQFVASVLMRALFSRAEFVRDVVRKK